MAYVDAYVLPVPKDRLDVYIDLATRMAALWREHGALSVTEAVADDAPVGVLTSFPRSVIATQDETVVFAFITYNDRAHRDAVTAAVFADLRMKLMMDVPVDGKRMIWGGFRVVVSA